MNAKCFYRRWKRQYVRGLKAVAKQLEVGRESGEAEAVHQLRVAIRRTRLLASIGRAVIGRKRALAFRVWAQRVADALSPVRDYDVMIEWAEEVCKDREFVQGLRKDRGQAWRSARNVLAALPPTEWPTLRRVRASRKEKRKLTARYAKIAGEAQQVVEADAKCFEQLDSKGRHDFRRTVRRFKYLQELQKKPRRSEPLGELQATLGELQNAEAMKGLLRNGHQRSGRARQLLRYVKRHQSEWYPRCRRSLKDVTHFR